MRNYQTATCERGTGLPALPEELLRVLPHALAQELRTVNGRIEEIRIRAGKRVFVTVGGENRMLSFCAGPGDPETLFVCLCHGSPYTAEETLTSGFLMLPGGVRVGVIGNAVVRNGVVAGVTGISSLAFRIPSPARRTQSGDRIRELLEKRNDAGGVLIWSPPGVGKTTLLSSVALALAGGERPRRTVLVDERGEFCFPRIPELSLDVLTGYPKRIGLEIAFRILSAEVMLCDEIGEGEVDAILAAANCGVPVIASAHASDMNGLLSRPGIARLDRAGVFAEYVGIRRERAGEYRFEIRERGGNT